MPTSILGLSVGAAGLLAAVLAALALWVVHAKKKDMWKAIGVVGIVAVFIGGGIQSSYSDLSNLATSSGGSAKAVASTPQGAALTPSSLGCNVAPAITYSSVDKFNTSASGATTTKIKVNAAPPVAAYATGAGGDVVEYLPTSASYFSSPVKATLPCGATQIIAETVDNSTGGHTFNIFNDEGNVMTNAGVGASVNLTLGSGAAKNVKMELTAPSRQAIAPFGATYCVEGADTKFDSSKTKFSGTSVSKPKAIVLSGTTDFVNCIEDLTPLTDSSSVSKMISVTAASGTNPTDDNVYVYVVAKTWFTDTDGVFKLGYQDLNNADKSKAVLKYTFDTD